MQTSSTDNTQATQDIYLSPAVGSKRRLDANNENLRDNNNNEFKYQQMATLLESAHATIASKDKEIDRLKILVSDLQRQLDLHRKENILIHVRRWCDLAKKRNFGNRSPLYLACEAGDLEGAKALLDCTYEMVTKNEGEDVKEFMRQSIDERINRKEKRNATVYFPLKVATMYGHTQVVDFLLSHNADIEAKDESESTPLHIACAEGKVDVAALLITKKANMEPIDREKSTPLQYAVENGHLESVALLLSNKANIESKNELTQQTPLQVALNAENIEILSTLIANRANIEVQDEELCTPLHNAVEMGNAEIVSLLVAHKANIGAKNKQGETPLDIAEDEDIQALLSGEP